MKEIELTSLANKARELQVKIDEKTIEVFHLEDKVDVQEIQLQNAEAKLLDMAAIVNAPRPVVFEQLQLTRVALDDCKQLSFTLEAQSKIYKNLIIDYKEQVRIVSASNTINDSLRRMCESEFSKSLEREAKLRKKNTVLTIAVVVVATVAIFK
jgi:hypothetical protein